MGRPRKEVVSYTGVHWRLTNDLGSASNFFCINCNEKAATWAYDYTSKDELEDEQGRVYTLDLSCYKPMCYPCHKYMDQPRKETCKNGHAWTEENTYSFGNGYRQCKKCRKEAEKRRRR